VLERVVREIRMLRAMRRALEKGLRKLLTGHEDGNVGYRQGVSYGLPRQCSTLPGTQIWIAAPPIRTPTISRAATLILSYRYSALPKWVECFHAARSLCFLNDRALLRINCVGSSTNFPAASDQPSLRGDALQEEESNLQAQHRHTQ